MTCNFISKSPFGVSTRFHTHSCPKAHDFIITLFNWTNFLFLFCQHECEWEQGKGKQGKWREVGAGGRRKAPPRIEVCRDCDFISSDVALLVPFRAKYELERYAPICLSATGLFFPHRALDLSTLARKLMPSFIRTKRKTFRTMRGADWLWVPSREASDYLILIVLSQSFFS